MNGKALTDYAVDCIRPVEMHLFGYPDRVLVDIGSEPDRPLSQRLNVRCRKCPPCLAARSTLWTARAIDECRAPGRTWFGTLTLNALERFRVQLEAEHKATATRCEPWHRLSSEDQFKAVAAQIAPHLTRYLKRLRKEYGSLRYLLVTEAHKDGFPHYHLLLHETVQPFRKARLDAQWKLGFTRWKLVETGDAAARYVCKYLAKSALTRVRASQDYGNPLASYGEIVDISTRVFSQRVRKTRDMGSSV